MVIDRDYFRALLRLERAARRLINNEPSAMEELVEHTKELDKLLAKRIVSLYKAGLLDQLLDGD